MKELRSFIGAINQLSRFIPNLAQLCAPLRPLLSKEKTTWEWTNENEEALRRIKMAIQAITEIKQIKKNQLLRIVCDASCEGLGAVLQQKTDKGWRAVHFASRFLTTIEQKYSFNELELLAVVWAKENSRNYVYGTEFEVVSDHKVLTSTLHGNRAEKFFSSILTRSICKLLPFKINSNARPGRTLGIADYLSMHASDTKRENQLKAEKLWNNWFNVSEINYEKPVLDGKNGRNTASQPISNELADATQVASVNAYEQTNYKEHNCHF